MKSNDKQQSVGSQTSSSSFTPEQMKKLLSLIIETSTGSIHANMAGAKQHLTVSNIGISNVLDIFNLKITVGHPKGTLATVSHVGNLQLTKNVMLYDVLVIPGYCDLKMEIILGTGSESGGIYLFDLQSDRNIGNVNIVHAYNVSKSLWHSRLGYSADQVLVVLKTDLSLSKSTDVSTCEDNSLSKGNVFENSIGSSSVPTHNLISETIDRVQSKPRSYAKVNYVNYCFATTLNKFIKPANYYEAALDPKWVEAMNDEIDALYRNHTWTIVELPKGRKAIGFRTVTVLTVVKRMLDDTKLAGLLADLRSVGMW
ncbi:hypothetical protein Tco_0444921 [Tanacetum coccineum]